MIGGLMYKIGIIGCGKIAQVRHIPEYIANSKAEIKAVYDINRNRAEEIALKVGATAYGEIDELLSSDLDAVSICTSNDSHAEIAVKALEKGINVLCEKPMAVTLESAERMVDAAEKSGKILMIGQNQRLNGTHMRAHDLIKRGEIGRVISFETVFAHSGPETWSIDPGKNTWFFDKKKAVMGAMADLGIHKTDLIRFLLDDDISSVSAKIATLDKRGADGSLIAVDDNAFVIYTMKSGAVGIMRASWTNYGPENNSTVIYGSEGVMNIFVNPEHSIEVVKKNGERDFYDVEKIQTNDSQTSSGVIDAFIESLDRGYTDISGEDVLKSMKAVFAALESAEKGKEERV